jgi:MYXO-CTERM domain-containing protein
MRSGHARLFLILVAALFTLSMPAASADDATPRISVFGDSVLLGAREQIISQLAPLEVSVDAHENLSLLGAIGVLQAAQPDLGDVVVLDLGYNDGTDLTAFRQRIDGAMSALGQVPRVIWLNQRVFADGRSAMNAELTEAAGRYPNLDVADWNSKVSAEPGLVYSDGIHLTPAGQVAMAALVRERVDAYTASKRPSPAPISNPAADAVRIPPGAFGGGSAATGRSVGTADEGSPRAPTLAIVAAAALVALAGALVVRRRRRALTP